MVTPLTYWAVFGIAVLLAALVAVLWIEFWAYEEDE